MSIKIKYQPTFSHFIDNYLTSYYSAGVQTFRRIAGGPLLIWIGSSILFSSSQISFYKYFGFIVTLYGLIYAIKPILQICLVWLRKDKFLDQNPVSLELDKEHQTIIIEDQKGKFTLPLSEINSIQHRSQNTWLLTTSDQMISIPRHNLLEGTHNTFIEAVEKILDDNEKKY